MTLDELVKQFQEDFKAAPKYQRYSRNLGRKIDTKANVQSEFIDNLQMLQCTTMDKAESDKIEALLKRFE
tara:strand:- start:454 stop:663 length:210 start_codon:yes stop_codon:yes gene_type:complete